MYSCVYSRAARHARHALASRRGAVEPVTSRAPCAHSEGSQARAAAFLAPLDAAATAEALRARSSCRNPSVPPRACIFMACMNFIHAVTTLRRRRPCTSGGAFRKCTEGPPPTRLRVHLGFGRGSGGGAAWAAPGRQDHPGARVGQYAAGDLPAPRTHWKLKQGARLPFLLKTAYHMERF
jgi:hypothetical protein